jgi:ribosome-associated toxin RatA of RatAB toxin-antitoxin module
MMRATQYSLCGILSLLSASTAAANIERLEVRQNGAEYSVSLAAVLEAPPKRIWAVLTDYAGFDELSPSVNESEIVGQLNRTTHRVRTRARVCVLIFCKEFRQVQTMEQRTKGELLIVIDPQQSDFEFGHARWLLFEDQGITRVHFDTQLRPAFWVPPLIGPWAIKSTLRREAQATCGMLERLAQMQSP